MTNFRRFSFKDANYNISSSHFDYVQNRIIAYRLILDAYCAQNPLFLKSLLPIPDDPTAPPIARAMIKAAALAGVGPLAAVAGAIAEYAALDALTAGASEVVIENGGDLYIHSNQQLLVGLYSGEQSPFNDLAFKILPGDLPLAVCSSSGTMGHSLSRGKCDLLTVVSRSACLADAAATSIANRIKAKADLGLSLESGLAITGIIGILAIKGQNLALVGTLPELIRHTDAQLKNKVTRDHYSDFNSINIKPKKHF